MINQHFCFKIAEHKNRPPVGNWHHITSEDYIHGLVPKRHHWSYITGIIVGMGSANERCRYNVTSSLIGWTHTQNDGMGSAHERHCCNVTLSHWLSPYPQWYGLSQWETPLQCNIVSHWLSPYPQWSLYNCWPMCYQGRSINHQGPFKYEDTLGVLEFPIVNIKQVLSL